ncbi:hypothetical protein [Flavobacterium sp. LB2P53]|uniref:hypothetical protein n=1 Tax=Flavobacterium sp. LB2P53 TaxID=2497481 RepID=UPI001F1D72D3|nr:hypothetical protein [Flavobacterium sp. LB2P53]
MIFFKYFLLVAILVFSIPAIGQTTYPKITGYFGILHPIVTVSPDGTNINFRDYYALGFPTGINIWKSPKIGFSFEIVPNIRAENGIMRIKG